MNCVLAYLLLCLAAWNNKGKHPFSRHFTLVRAVLWNFFLLASLIECCDTVRERRKQVIRGSPETACQLTFWGGRQVLLKRIYTQKRRLEKTGLLVLNRTQKSLIS